MTLRRVGAVASAALLLGGAAAALADPVDVVVAPDSGTGEPEVEVSPRDPNTIVVGKNDSGVAVSHDHGMSFKQVAMENPGDHVLTVAPDGTFFYSALDGAVRMSTDNGDTWSTVGNWVGAVAEQAHAQAGSGGIAVAGRELACSSPAPAGPVNPVPGPGPGPHVIGCDRPWLTADKQNGTLYVSFTDHNDNGGGDGVDAWELQALGCKAAATFNPAFECGRSYVAASHDRGKTWSAFRPFDSGAWPAGGTGGFNSGAVATGGVLATAYIAAATPTGAHCYCLVFETSRDEGATWTRHLVAPVTLPTWDTLNNPLIGKDQSLLFEPYVAGDPNDPDHYAVMADADDLSHLLVWTTNDAGVTWQGPAKLSDPFGTTRNLPWLAIGPTGAVGAMWRSTAADGSYTTWAAVAKHGNTRFAAPVRISMVPSPGPVSTVAGDDASDLTLDDTDLHVVWGDHRDGSMAIHYGRYRFAPPGAP